MRAHAVRRVEVERLTEWLWCLRTPIVQAYAVLAGIAGQPARVHEVLLTHGHDDHTGSAATMRERTGARLVAPREEAAVLAGERPLPPPQLADREVPIFEQVTPNVPAAPPAVPDRLVSPGDRLGWEHDGEPLRRDAAARLAELAR